MSENQYFANQPEVAHHLQQWSFELLGNDLKFNTDSGVFSKKTVDYGSRVLLEAFNIDELPTGRLLDVGCGYGPIGLSLAKKLPARIIEMVDVNERALNLARKNAKDNQLENIEIYESNCYEKVETIDFAGIISNPPIRAGKAVVQTILREAYQHLQVEGTLTVVLQKKQGAPSAKKEMQRVFGNAEIVHKDKGYYILKSYKEVE